MKKTTILITLLFSLFSCNDDVVIKDTPINVFNTFWKTLNERYVYLDEKNIDCDSVYNVYSPRIKSMKNDEELSVVFQEIINLFKDRHLGIVKNSNEYIGYYPVDTIGYFYPLYSGKYGFELFPRFSGTNGLSIIYQHETKKYVYIQYNTFREKTDVQLFQSNLKKLNYTDGIIIDIRNNGGGFSNYALGIASMFFSGERTAFYETPKNNVGKKDFENPVTVKYHGENTIPSTIPIVILTSNKTYSAANLFSYLMHDLPNCVTIGEKTGGGGSPIKSVYLPNGWILFYPNTKNISAKGENMESGLEPDFKIKYTSFKDSIQFIKAMEILDSINGFPKTNYR